MAGIREITQLNAKKSNGRPKGATTRPQFYTYTDEQDRKEFAVWIKKVFKKKGNSDLAKWYGDQMFGKALQPIGGDPNYPLVVKFDEQFRQSKTT